MSTSSSSLAHSSLLALALALAQACGSGGEVYLGAAKSLDAGSGGQTGGMEPGICGDSPCADFRGTRVFSEASSDSDAAVVFAQATDADESSDPARLPNVIYPSDETVFPLDASALRFEWRVGGNTRFELTFSGPNTQVIVYTNDDHFTPSAEEWAWIAESNRGAAVALTVRALGADSAVAFRAHPLSLRFAASALGGTVYYWSTAAHGVMKARLTQAHPQKFFSQATGMDSEKCVGCHSLSRDGKLLAASSDPGELRVVSLSDGSVVFPANAGVGGGGGAGGPMKMMDEKAAHVPAAWTSFAPDGKSLVVANGGKLSWVELGVGNAPTPAQNIQLPPGSFATHPDWSPAGDRVVFTLGKGGSDRDLEAGAIALAKYQDGAFGLPELIVPSAGPSDNNYFPVFSPDARYIAFVNAQTRSQDARSARIRLLELDSRRIIDLPRLNQRVNELENQTNLANSMPTFAPTAGGYYWLAFSSVRPYASLRALDPKLDQIFIAALDPTQADPSYAAFWAPFQSLDHGNHRAFWAAGPADSGCGCVDCREHCAEHEVCGDGVDDDCDCVVDDCAREVCGDGADNDGDGRSDKDDPACGG